jgi:4-hydroxybenzoyl-CoA thioesterase
MSHRTFTQTRIIKWGECDPAGIVYTPRILDYAMEAVEAWYRDALGVPWVELNANRRLGSPMVHASIDFKKPVRPDRALHVHLRIAALGRSTIAFDIVGENDAAEPHFHVRMKACIVDLRDYRPTAIPPAFRAKAEAYLMTRPPEEKRR